MQLEVCTEKLDDGRLLSGLKCPDLFLFLEALKVKVPNSPSNGKRRPLLAKDARGPPEQRDLGIIGFAHALRCALLSLGIPATHIVTTASSSGAALTHIGSLPS